MACVRGGFAGAELDIAATLAASTAQGVPAVVVMPWIAAFSAGLAAGTAAWKEHREDQRQQERSEL